MRKDPKSSHKNGTRTKRSADENRLKEMGLPTLQDRRQKGDLLTLYKMVNDIEKLDKQDLVMMKEETRQRTLDEDKKVSL